MTSRSTEGHKKVICKRCEVKKVKKQKLANDVLGAHGNKRPSIVLKVIIMHTYTFLEN